MARTRQHSLNGSPPVQGRAGSGKLRVSRREGLLLSLVVVLGIAVCAIAFYKTGDPSLPLAPGQLRRPGDARADELPSSLSNLFWVDSCSACAVHRGKPFTNVDGIRVREVEDAGEDITDAHQLEGEDPVVVDTEHDTDDDDALYTDDEVDVIEEEEDHVTLGPEDMLVLPSHNPYAQMQQVRSPDGTPIQQRPATSQPATDSMPDRQQNNQVPALQTQPTEQSPQAPTKQSTNAIGAVPNTQPTEKAPPVPINQSPNTTGAVPTINPSDKPNSTAVTKPIFQQPLPEKVIEQAQAFNSSVHAGQTQREQITHEKIAKQDTATHTHEEPAPTHKEPVERPQPVPEDGPTVSQQSNLTEPAPHSMPQTEHAPQTELAPQTEIFAQLVSVQETGIKASEEQAGQPLVESNVSVRMFETQNYPAGPQQDSHREENKKQLKKRISDRIKDIRESYKLEVEERIRAGMSGEELHAHQSFIQDVLDNGLPSTRPSASGPSVSLHSIIRVDNLTTSEFEFRFASEFGLQPVVVSNSQNDWFSPEKFSLEELRKLIGSKPVRVQSEPCGAGAKARDTNICHSIKESDPELVGRRWASLKPTNLTEIGVDTYDEFLSKQIELAKEGRYIYAHEISGGWLPEIEAIIRQPKYFLNNIQDLDWGPNLDIEDRVRAAHFPSIFFGASGSSSPLHSDARMTRFWIMQLAGRKLLRLVPPAENWRGDASDSKSYQPSLFTVDLMHPDYEKHPNMHNMIVYEAVLEPGDILFIPEGWGHQALNLEWTWMISSNYIDEHNLPNLLNYIYYDKGPGKAFRDAEVDLDHFFLPINNPSKNLTNLALEEYFRRLTLEYAPVSDAAKHHCKLLANLSIPPEDWRDRHSKRLMTAAFETNYVALAQWLYKQGVPLENDIYGRTMLKWVMHNGMDRMELWMRTVMEVDEDDKLADIPDGDEEEGVAGSK